MTKHIEVFSMPFDDRSNKYFSLWRSAMLAYADQVTIRDIPGNNLVRFLFTHGWSRESERIISIHWSTILYGSRYLFKSIVLLSLNMSVLGILKRFFHFKIVWVLHNNYAHDYPHPRVDRRGRALLWCMADTIIVQQETTYHTFAGRYPHKQIAYVPHGHYIGAYGPRVFDRTASRAKHAFKADDIVLLCLGSIRPYKKIDMILRAFVSAGDALDPRIHLWVAGKGESRYVSTLLDHAKDRRQIRIENAFVPDDMIPEYLACADYSVFFYDDSELTSGGIILSLSYGVPVIARAVAGAEVIGESGLVFDTMDGLIHILEQLPHAAPSDPMDVIKQIEHQHWDESARRLTEIYTRLAH